MNVQMHLSLFALHANWSQYAYKPAEYLANPFEFAIG